MMKRRVEEVKGNGGRERSWVETYAQQTDGVMEGEKKWAETALFRISWRWGVLDCVSLSLTPPCLGPDPALPVLMQKCQPSVTLGTKVQLILVFESGYTDIFHSWSTHWCLPLYKLMLCGQVLLKPTAMYLICSENPQVSKDTKSGSPAEFWGNMYKMMHKASRMFPFDGM